MKLQIDTDFKTIKIENDVEIDVFIKTLQKLLPNGEYKKYKLLTNTVLSYQMVPIYIRQYEPVYPVWEYPTPGWKPNDTGTFPNTAGSTYTFDIQTNN